MGGQNCLLLAPGQWRRSLEVQGPYVTGQVDRPATGDDVYKLRHLQPSM